MISLIAVVFLFGYAAIAVWAGAGGTKRLLLAAVIAGLGVASTGLLIASHRDPYRIDLTLRSGIHLYNSLILVGGALGAPVVFLTFAVWLLARRHVAGAIQFAAALTAGLVGMLLGVIGATFATLR